MALGKYIADIVQSLSADWIASDAFAGGFCAGIVQGKSLAESMDMGQWLASLSIQELGPSYVPPYYPNQPRPNIASSFPATKQTFTPSNRF
jgi:hypothetical protein